MDLDLKKWFKKDEEKPTGKRRTCPLCKKELKNARALEKHFAKKHKASVGVR